LAGIYIHIPFCKQACHYCNFHFSTSLRYKNELVAALLKEMDLQHEYFAADRIDTIYVGGGTPSLCTGEEIKNLLEKIQSLFNVDPSVEITLEANPDDINNEKLEEWKLSGINRLSIGVQSFFEEDLRWMNRAHTAMQATENLQLARERFNNITMDLIYGSPGLTNEKWKQNVERAIAFDIPHLSCYALTVEPKTPLDKLIKQHRSADVDPGLQSEQFLMLMDWMANAGYEHYEISNFAKPGFRSRHNSSYWQGKKYIGFGPSAHSFDGNSRWWNISNNQQYIDSIRKGIIPMEKEELTVTQKLNEFIMISLRTIEGLDLSGINEADATNILWESQKYIDKGLIKKEKTFLRLTNEGKLLADGIAADLFRN
jgi:oxygen-independent coproporphyrinogen III oxidase